MLSSIAREHADRQEQKNRSGEVINGHASGQERQVGRRGEWVMNEHAEKRKYGSHTPAPCGWSRGAQPAAGCSSWNRGKAVAAHHQQLVYTLELKAVKKSRGWVEGLRTPSPHSPLCPRYASKQLKEAAACAKDIGCAVLMHALVQTSTRTTRPQAAFRWPHVSCAARHSMATFTSNRSSRPRTLMAVSHTPLP